MLRFFSKNDLRQISLLEMLISTNNFVREEEICIELDISKRMLHSLIDSINTKWEDVLNIRVDGDLISLKIKNHYSMK